MAHDARRGRRGRDEAVQPDQAALDAVGEVLDTQLADLVAYCRGLTSREEEAVSTAHTVMDSAQALLQDPDRLRAWLFALARRETLADGTPRTQEILDLVHRHGIQPRDLPVVLGIPAVEADNRLAAAEREYAERADDNSDRDSANGWHDGTGSPGADPARPDDTAWRHETAWRHDTAWRDETAWRDDSGDLDDGHRLEDLDGLMRTPPDGPADDGSRRARGAGAWRALSGGRARLAAATAMVVAVIGVGAAYLTYSAHHGQPAPAGLQTTRHPSPATQSPSPASTPSPTPTASPSRSPAKRVTVVPPPPAPTSAKPKPSPTHSTSPSPKPSSQSPSITPSSTSPSP